MTVTTSETQIANMALSHLGDAKIESLSDTDSAEAAEARTWYGYSRVATLEAADWNFARKRVVATLDTDTISTTVNTPLAGVWGFRYRYPADCIMMRKIQHPAAPPADAFPFEVEVNLKGTTKTVLTDVENAVLVYTMDQELTNLYTPGFVLAMSLMLGSNMAFSLTGKLSLKKSIRQEFLRTLPAAAASAANEQVSPPPRDADWLRARNQDVGAVNATKWQAYPDGSN